MKALLPRQLSGFYFFYFAALGVLVPYWPLYLRALGFGAQRIGVLMALPLIARVIAPALGGFIADRYGRPIMVVRTTTLIAAACAVALFFSRHLWWVAATTSACTFFWYAALPQLETVTLTTVGHRYGRVRLWGSIGFIAAVLLLGLVLDRSGPRLIPAVLVLLLLALAVVSQFIGAPAAPALPPVRARFRQRVGRSAVWAFLGACFLMQASHGPYYTFYSLDLAAHGYSKAMVGALWAFAVFCEIAVFLWGGRLFIRFSLRLLFLSSFVLAAVRWLLIGVLVRHPWWLLGAQVLHAATFGLYHATAVQITYRFFKGAYRNRGQALYGAAAGAGGAWGSLYSGYLWHRYGPVVTFVSASVLDLVAWVLIFLGLRSAVLAFKPLKQT